MRSKIIAFVLMMTLAFAASGYAADRAAKTRGNKREAGMQTERMRGGGAIKELGLTKAQVKQIMEIVRGYRKDAGEIMKSTAARDEKKDKIQVLKTKAEAAINALLTPEQQQKAKEKNMIAKLLAFETAREAKLMLALKQLDLTPDQQAKIKAIFEDSEAKAKAIRQDTTLTDEAEAAKLKALREETHKQVMAALTAEQQKKLKELLAKRGSPRAGK